MKSYYKQEVYIDYPSYFISYVENLGSHKGDIIRVIDGTIRVVNFGKTFSSEADLKAKGWIKADAADIAYLKLLEMGGNEEKPAVWARQR